MTPNRAWYSLRTKKTKKKASNKPAKRRPARTCGRILCDIRKAVNTENSRTPNREPREGDQASDLYHKRNTSHVAVRKNRNPVHKRNPTVRRMVWKGNPKKKRRDKEFEGPMRSVLNSICLTSGFGKCGSFLGRIDVGGEYSDVHVKVCQVKFERFAKVRPLLGVLKC